MARENGDSEGMRQQGNRTTFRLWSTCAAVAAAGLLLANCSSSPGNSKYGVSASTRVVEPGAPVPKGGGVYRVGKPYVIAGKTYVPEVDFNYRAEGMASWYGDDFHGRYTANGEIFDMNSITAAHPTLPLPSYVRVTNLRNHRSLMVRVNDRGPFAHNRLIDLSVRSAKLLGFHDRGLTQVRVEYVGKAPLAGSDDRKLEATLRNNGRPMPGQREPVRVASAKSFAPELFDARPMMRIQASSAQPLGREPGPPGPATDSRPAGRDSVQIRPLAKPAGVSSPVPVRSASAEAIPGQMTSPPVDGRLTSPVSAYAPVRYDVSSGIMSGRGLY